MIYHVWIKKKNGDSLWSHPRGNWHSRDAVRTAYRTKYPDAQVVGVLTDAEYNWKPRAK